MKATIFLIFICFASLLNAQNLPVDSLSGRVNFKDSIVHEGMSKNQLFDHAQKWFKTAFEGVPSSIDHKDKGNGIIQGTSTATIPITANGSIKQVYVKFNIEVQIFEGAYTYSFSNIEFKDFPNDRNASPSWLRIEPMNAAPVKNPSQEQYLTRTDNNIQGLIENLKHAMEYGVCKRYRWMSRYSDD